MNHSPGLFDFQVNGFAGVDFQSDELTLPELQHAVQELRRHDTAKILLTLITDDIDRLCRRFERIERMRADDPSIAAMIPGYHLEGPWLSPERGFSGAHSGERMRPPSGADFERLNLAAGGRIRLVTLAPEWPGSTEFIGQLRSMEVEAALGHTDATEEQIDAAISAGARFCTHLGNGVPLVLPRHDNIIQRLLARDELIACFIPDGIHLPPFVLRNLVRAKPPGHVLFTTDAMAGAASGPGPYRIGSLEIQIGTDGIARQPDHGGFAGSTLTPDEGVRRTAAYLGLDPQEARRLWSTAAAEAFGIALT